MGGGVSTRLFDKIKKLIEKVKKFINEKILKKKMPETLQVNKTFWQKFKDSLSKFKKFLSLKFKAGINFFKKHKVITAAVVAACAVGTIETVKGAKVEIKRSEYQSQMENCGKILSECNQLIDDADRNLQAMKKAGVDGVVETRQGGRIVTRSKYVQRKVKLDHLAKGMVEEFEKTKKLESELPEYGSVLFKIAAAIDRYVQLATKKEYVTGINYELEKRDDGRYQVAEYTHFDIKTKRMKDKLTVDKLKKFRKK